MPTARELIEQADALMRRNRPPAERAHDAHPPPMPSAHVPQQEPSAESSVDESASPPEPEIGGDDDVPLLTEAIDDAELLGDAPAFADDAGTRVDATAVADDAAVHGATTAVTDVGDVQADADAFADDVPVLTDAIEEIEEIEEIEAPPAPEESAEAETSDWLLDERGEAGVLGRNVESMIAVPPAGEVAGEASAAAFAAQDAVDEATNLAVPGGRAEIDAGPAQASATHGEANLAPHLTDAEIERALGLDSASAIAPVPEPSAASADAGAQPAKAPRDDAEWDALAEEIRMQVLQRIDIFTDTGLRARLGERLQPVVDRASADLVATINQHVGELLRAYVAEAIEREIEKWRQQSGGR